MYTEALNPKIDKKRRKELFDDLASSLVVVYRLLTFEAGDFPTEL